MVHKNNKNVKKTIDRTVSRCYDNRVCRTKRLKSFSFKTEATEFGE